MTVRELINQLLTLRDVDGPVNLDSQVVFHVEDDIEKSVEVVVKEDWFPDTGLEQTTELQDITVEIFKDYPISYIESDGTTVTLYCN